MVGLGLALMLICRCQESVNRFDLISVGEESELVRRFSTR